MATEAQAAAGAEAVAAADAEALKCMEMATLAKKLTTQQR
jgi:hypothetical protein